MTPPRSSHLVALYLRVMFCAAFDGLKVGEVRWGGHGLPSCPLPPIGEWRSRRPR